MNSSALFCKLLLWVLKGLKAVELWQNVTVFKPFFPPSLSIPHFLIRAQFDLTWFDLSPATFSLNKVTKSYLLRETRPLLDGKVWWIFTLLKNSNFALFKCSAWRQRTSIWWGVWDVNVEWSLSTYLPRQGRCPATQLSDLNWFKACFFMRVSAAPLLWRGELYCHVPQGEICGSDRQSMLGDVHRRSSAEM